MMEKKWITIATKIYKWEMVTNISDNGKIQWLQQW